MEKDILLTDMAQLAPMITELLHQGREVKLTVTGNSMFPLLRHGLDQVVLQRAGKLKRGDVPLYRRSSGDYILHRIAKCRNGFYELLGDNQQDLEFPIYPNQIIAVAKGFYRGERYISCTSPLYRLYAHTWLLARPVRKYIMSTAIRRWHRRKGKNTL